MYRAGIKQRAGLGDSDENRADKLTSCWPGTDCEGMDAEANSEAGLWGERQDGANHRTAVFSVRFQHQRTVEGHV